MIEENKQICENDFLNYIATNVKRFDSIQSNQVQNTSENFVLFIKQFETLKELISLDSITSNKDELDKVKTLIDNIFDVRLNNFEEQLTRLKETN